MKCYDCGGNEATEGVEVVNLDEVAQVEALVRRCPSCGRQSVSYDRVEELLAQVAQELSVADRRLLAHELRWLRKYTGASGQDWAGFIGRDAATLSRWENAHEPYPLAFERLLRFAAQEAMEWPYEALNKLDKVEPMQLRTNSAGRWVRQ